MEIRTFGWIQNPSDLNKLKLTVNTFDCDSEHYQKLLNVIILKLQYEIEHSVNP